MLTHAVRTWRGRLRLRRAFERRSLARGRLAEFVRLLFVLLFAAAGYTIATPLSPSPPSGGPCWGCARTSTGSVLGGVLGGQTAVAVRSMEEELRKVPAA